jgi:hypothetical protein
MAADDLGGRDGFTSCIGESKKNVVHMLVCSNVCSHGIGSMDGNSSRIDRGREGDMFRHGYEDSRGFGEDEVAVDAVTGVQMDGGGTGAEILLKE